MCYKMQLNGNKQKKKEVLVTVSLIKKKKKKFWKRDQRIINYDRKKNMLVKKLIGAKKTFQKVTAGSGRPQGWGDWKTIFL